jgi:hypothetical protein
MTNKKKLALILSPIILLCLLCAAPLAYIAYRDNQEYQADLDRQTAIAEKLGYSDLTHIRFYRELTYIATFDIIYLTFYSTQTFDEFSENVELLGLVQRYYYHDQSLTNTIFVEELANRHSTDMVVTLNISFEKEDFENPLRPPPIVTEWVLKDTESNHREITIYYAELLPLANDVWRVQGQPIQGNIVVVTLDRRTGD